MAAGFFLLALAGGQLGLTFDTSLGRCRRRDRAPPPFSWLMGPSGVQARRVGPFANPDVRFSPAWAGSLPVVGLAPLKMLASCS